MPQKFDESFWAFEEKIRNGYTFSGLLPTLSKYMDWIKKYINGKVRILDEGCGFGYFLKLCDKTGWETYGIDISSYAINKAKENTKAQLYLHDIQDFGESVFKDDYFDLITMFDVIEHLAYPFNALIKTHKILKKHGKLVITTPNLNAIHRMFLRILAKQKFWYGFLDVTHTHLFTPFSLKTLVKAEGFKVLELKTPFQLSHFTLNRVLEKTGLGGQIWLLAEKTS
jgi:2-polyprenyl-3-methyl-5-hydroxy-6-metoxy-1,4-benzoquinol methylase